MKIDSLVRPSIKALKMYASARDEFDGNAEVFLDANESPYTNLVNRYPDPYQSLIKAELKSIFNVEPSQLFLGNGSDEAIDLLFRIFCEPGVDNCLIMSPTYGMYKVSAEINNVTILDAHLTSDFQIDVEKVLQTQNENTKLTFVCSPNNPSGNLLNNRTIEELLEKSNGIVVVDEAYGDFNQDFSWTSRIEEFDNLVVLRTFSKAWGMAGIRLGMAFANGEIIHYFNKVKPPYNVNVLTQRFALEQIQKIKGLPDVAELTLERGVLEAALPNFEFVRKIHPSDANFLLVEVEDADGLYGYMMDKGIILRNRSTQLHCEGCLRITIGTPEENKALLAALKIYQDEKSTVRR